jgi:hypothetical protein
VHVEVPLPGGAAAARYLSLTSNHLAKYLESLTKLHEVSHSLIALRISEADFTQLATPVAGKKRAKKRKSEGVSV